MTQDSVLHYWNQRAALAEKAGSADLVAKRLEIEAIARHIRNGMRVAEFGCGNGITAIELARRFDIELLCFDFSAAMIEAATAMAAEAGVAARVRFAVADVRDEPVLEETVDAIYTERMLINLPDWPAQQKAIRYLVGHLRPGGRFLMCENSATGLSQLNALRAAAGLEPISPPWHNVYFDDAEVAGLDLEGARLASLEAYSGTYYFLSRVVNAWLAAQEGKTPSYDAPVNQLALQLPPVVDCAQGKLWIFEKTR